MRIFKNNSKQKKMGERKPGTKATSRTVIPRRETTTQPVTRTEPKIIQQKDREYHAVKKVPETTQRTVDPNLQFQMMYGLSEPKEPGKNNTVAANTSATTPIKTSLSGVRPVKSTTGFGNTILPKPIVYKKLVKKKLNIILIENTAVVSEHKEKVTHIINRFLSSDFLCVINYTGKVDSKEIIEVPIFSKPNISYCETTQEKACLFDALIELEKIVSSKYLVTEEKETEKVCIDNIEIIGIGTCTDNCSTANKQDALEAFEKVASKDNIITKYYCLTDEYVIGAAEIGFRSIGSISAVFQ